MRNLILLQHDSAEPSFRALGEKLRTTLEARAAEVATTLERLTLRPEPGPATLIVDEALMDKIYPPDVLFEDENGPWLQRPLPPDRTIEGAEGIDPLAEEIRTFHAAYAPFVAAGVCFVVTPELRRILRGSFAQPVALPGAYVVALCAPRVERIGDTAVCVGGQADACFADAAEVIWLHELIHWSHGVRSSVNRSKVAEEAITQIVLSQLLNTHPRGPNLLIVLGLLTDRLKSLPAYGSYRAMREAQSAADEGVQEEQENRRVEFNSRLLAMTTFDVDF